MVLLDLESNLAFVHQGYIMRLQPNIIVTGTPGVGKTIHCEALAQTTGLRHLSINHVVKDRGCHDGWDENFQSWIVDEDKVSFRDNSDFVMLFHAPSC